MTEQFESTSFPSDIPAVNEESKLSAEETFKSLSEIVS